MVDWLTQVATETWRIALEMAPYIVLGLIAAVLVYAVFPKHRIRQWLGKPGPGSAIKAALAGIPMPLCSCGVLPVALSLKKQGASDGATVSFLVSEPETGADSIAVTYALINPAMTIIRPIAALITAVATGLAVERFAPSKPLEDEDRTNRTDTTYSSWGERIRDSFQYVMHDFLPDIANWLVLGIVLSGVLAVIIPANWFEGVATLGQMAMGILIGVPLYICASASTPIAAVFLAKGMSPGAALVFLLVGPATNAASFLVISRMLGMRTAVAYIAGLIASSVVIGVLVDALFGGWDWTPKIADPSHGEHIGVFHWAGLGVLVFALGYVWLRALQKTWRKRHLTQTVAIPER